MIPKEGAVPSEPWRMAPLLALALGFFLCFVHLGDFPLLVPDEGRNAEVAREMKVAGSWLVPTYQGATYLDKPAFFFKSVALALAAFGDSEWAARLPSALSASAWLLMLYGVCRSTYGRRTASLAVIVVAATPLYAAFSRIVIFDMMLGLFVSMAIFFAAGAAEAEGPRRRRGYLLASLAAGLATLVKGPVGFLIPLLVVSIHHLVMREGRRISAFFYPLHVLLFLAVVLPWFVGLSLECPDFPYYGIMKESIARFTTTEFKRTQPAYFYAIIIAACFFPFSTVLPFALTDPGLRRRLADRTDRLFQVWALTVVVFFSLSQSKLPGYILTGVVALGVLVARIFALALEGEVAAVRVFQRALFLLAVVALLMTVPLATGLWAEDLSSMPRALSVAGLNRFLPLFPGLLLSLGLTAFVALTALGLRSVPLGIASFLVFPVLLLTLNFEVIPRYAGIKSARALHAALPRDLPVETEFACIACLPHGLPFYLGKTLTIFTQEGGELTSNYVLFSLSSGKPWPDRLVPLGALGERLAGRRHPLYLMAREEGLARLRTLAGPEAAEIQRLPGGYVGVLLPAPGP